MNAQIERGTPHEKAAMVSFAAMVGTAVENYSFFIYSSCAALYFGEVFFQTSDRVVGVLASFATFAVGFLFRPLGGYLSGHYGDRLGRKRVLLWSLLIMGIATVLIGCLPTYGQIGILAPILLVVLRSLQGVGEGAEWGGAVLMAVEHSPAQRRGFFGSLPQIGIPIGLLLANGAILLSQSFFGGSDWSWRAPFLFSTAMVAVGLFIRLRVEESPEFTEMEAQNEIRDSPALDVLRRDWRSVLRISGLRLAETGGYYIVTSFMISYVALAGLADKNAVLIGTVVGSAIGLISHPFYGALSDRIGRKPVFLFGSVFTILFGFPMFLLVNTGAGIAVGVAVAVGLLLSHDPIFAVEASWFPELFSREVRQSGISLGHNGAAIVAGALPFVATLLYDRIGWVGAAALFTLLGVISTAIGILTRETAPARRSSGDSARAEAGAFS
ncbi:MHS family MFS transporter [Mycolicibacterium septicum DSM 44393]|uniref:MHS family MFS transporter n=1 Tax=Mycolicibacterium septicum DSM 44393 TaxID=1341646 RepID=A0A7X6MMD2_9MYCO|nr:MFS transporter [Mycolicibacterium septicum]NKZ10819.1 MHS family MFS transporter [Mycolicibacterium septicum DSM 44393]